MRNAKIAKIILKNEEQNEENTNKKKNGKKFQKITKYNCKKQK